jgi:hypothetical protein
VTIRNNASVNYSISLICSTDNRTYQEEFVTFDDMNYDVVPRQQQLTVWLEVKSNASPTIITLTIDLKRMEEGP